MPDMVKETKIKLVDSLHEWPCLLRVVNDGRAVGFLICEQKFYFQLFSHDAFIRTNKRLVYVKASPARVTKLTDLISKTIELTTSFTTTALSVSIVYGYKHYRNKF